MSVCLGLCQAPALEYRYGRELCNAVKSSAMLSNATTSSATYVLQQEADRARRRQSKNIVMRSSRLPSEKNEVEFNLKGADLKAGFWLCSTSTQYESHVMQAYVTVLDELALYHNYSYREHFLCAGGFQAAVKELQDGSIDLICDVVVSEERERTVKFCEGIIRSRFVFITNAPDKQLIHLTVLSPFHTNTWLLIFVWVTIVSGLLTVVNSLRPPEGEYRRSRTEMVCFLFIYIFGTLLNQGGTYKSSNVAVRMLLGWWWVFAVVVMGLYTGTLVSYLSIKTTTVYPFTTLREAAESPITPMVLRNFVVETVLRNSHPESDFGKLWSKILADPRALVDKPEDAVDLIITGKYTLVFESEWQASLLAEDDYARSGLCRLAIIPVDYLTTASCATSYSSPYIDAVSEGVARLSEHGILQKWRKTEWLVNRTCNYREEDTVAANSLTMSQLKNVFLLLGGGTCVGFACMCVEAIVKLRKNVVQQKHGRCNARTSRTLHCV